MKTLEEHRKALEYLTEGGAFLRTDRKMGLFVTDVLRRTGRLPVLPEGYSAVTENGLTHILPETDELPQDMYISVLKADAVSREKLIRQSLAAAMREKDKKTAAFLTELADKFKIDL